jgi:dienelactone hydrolase
MRTFTRFAFAAALTLAAITFAADPSLPERDHRGDAVKTLNTLRTFPEIKSRSEWEQRAQAIREQALVSCGLWPLPEKTPLNAKIFGRIERDGYSVEKVYFQSYPGFYVAGNLYRPLGKGTGPFPGVLNPHGHWAKGRLEDSADGSSAARCINFAKQGMVAFAWDMVGYNDTQFARPAGEPGYKTHRNFANDLTNQLWGISQMGLQTWNAVRALDFLLSLPDVDPKRVACTGESGGGTQTFMLGAIDDRLAAQAPIVMVSHSMQGGCSCENAPGLRVDYSNMEISAQPAPRRQILVGATGDWTKATMEIEGPSIEKVYRLFNGADQLRYARFDFNHNYNQTSREAVYGFFSKQLRSGPDEVKEAAYTKEPDADLRVFPDGKLPDGAVTEEQLMQYLMKSATNEWWTFAPINPPLLERYRRQMLPAWKRTLQVGFIERGLMVLPGRITKAEDYTSTTLALGRTGRGDRIPATLITPRRDTFRIMAVLAHPEGQRAFLNADGSPKGLARKLIDKGLAVLLFDSFQTGSATNAGPKRDYSANYFTTYNRTDVQERVQDLVTVCAFAQTHGKGRRVALCGLGRAGLWTLLAAPASDALVADCAQFDSTEDRNLLAQDLFVPGLRKIGAFEGVAAINTTHPLLLHNTGGKFTTSFLNRVYRGMHVSEAFRQETAALSDDEIADWLSKLQVR